MAWQQTPYTLPLVVTGAALAAFAASLLWLGRTRPATGRGPGLAALLLATGATWVGAYALELSATTLEGKLFFLAVENVAIVALPPLWLAYVCWYTGREDRLTLATFGAVGAVGATLLTLLLANPAGVVYPRLALAEVDGILVLEQSFGPGFGLYLAYAYVQLAAATALLAVSFVGARGVLRRQVGALLVFSLVPAVAGAAYVLGLNPVPGINVAAVSTVVTAVAGAVSLVRFRWMDVTPVARDRAFDAVSDAVVVCDPDGRVVDANRRAETVFADASDTVVGERLEALAPPLATLVRAEGDTETTRTVELAVADGDGDADADADEGECEVAIEERTFEATVAPLESVPGEGHGATVLLHDVTARSRAEDRLRSQSERIERLHGVTRELAAARSREAVFEVAVEGAADVLDCPDARLSVVDGDRLRPRVSAAREDVDRSASVPLDGGFAGLAHRTGEVVVVPDLADTRSGAAAATASTDGGPLTGPDGPETPSTPDEPGEDAPDGGDGSGEPEATPDGEDERECEPEYRSLLTAPVGEEAVLQGFARAPEAFDDDDRRLAELLADHAATALDRIAAEAELRRERDRLEEFASVVSHDLRNPLNVAKGRVQLAAEETGSEHLDPAVDALDRMEELIEDGLALARQGVAAGDREDVDLETVAREAWAAVGSGDAALVVDSTRSLRADPSRLQQAFENLFRNAVEHGGEEVTVVVEALSDGFAVTDDGPGVPPDEREAVFEPGYTTSTDGTGLGLAIVRQIARAHGWEPRVTEGDAGGARFEFRAGVEEAPHERALDPTSEGE